MRKVAILSLLTLLLSCTNNEERNRNPFLIDVGFQAALNTNLPQFSSLNFPGNFVIVPNIGIRGVVVYHVGNSQYFAYDLADPNHALRDCSMMTVSAITATCPCNDDNNTYNIITGQPITGNGIYGLKAYRVSRIDNIINVSN